MSSAQFVKTRGAADPTSGTGAAVAVENGLFIWRATTSSWTQANTALKAGTHQLSARVINTHTWDVGTEVDAANRATLSVQSLNFNQLLLNDDPATNQIPANQSAGAVVLNGAKIGKNCLVGAGSLVTEGKADLVKEFTFTYPSRIIAGLLGLPEEDYPQFQRWSISLLSWIMNPERGLAASAALVEYFNAHADRLPHDSRRRLQVNPLRVLASVQARQRVEASNAKARDQISDLQEFVRRFSANASKARQATSRRKQ